MIIQPIVGGQGDEVAVPLLRPLSGRNDNALPVLTLITRFGGGKAQSYH